MCTPQTVRTGAALPHIQVLSFSFCQHYVRKSISDIHGSIQNHPRLHRDASKNQIPHHHHLYLPIMWNFDNHPFKLLEVTDKINSEITCRFFFHIDQLIGWRKDPIFIRLYFSIKVHQICRNEAAVWTQLVFNWSHHLKYIYLRGWPFTDRKRISF